MNSNPMCDGGTNCDASPEVRRLPLSEDSALIVCKKHYKKEMFFRTMHNNSAGRKLFETPDWDDLEIVNAEEIK